MRLLTGGVEFGEVEFEAVLHVYRGGEEGRVRLLGGFTHQDEDRLSYCRLTQALRSLTVW